MKVFLVYHYSSVNVEYYNDMPQVVCPWERVYKAGDKTFYVLGAFLSVESAEKAIKKQAALQPLSEVICNRDNWEVHMLEAE